MSSARRVPKPSNARQEVTAPADLFTKPPTSVTMMMEAIRSSSAML
jgi:hypothetical protein